MLKEEIENADNADRRRKMAEENPANIVMVCHDCLDKVYPNRGKYTSIEIGDFAKLAFNDIGRVEHMWVRVTGKTSEVSYEGELDNDPVLVQNIAFNDQVKFSIGEVEQVLEA